jgi:glycosyltransferase 2 family protein
MRLNAPVAQASVRRKIIFWCFLGIGAALFAALLSSVDTHSVMIQLQRVGLTGLGIVLAVYLLAFFIDALSWLLAVLSTPVTWTWSARFFLVRLAGETYNTLLPAAGFGGEPVKVLLLERCYGITYHEGTASLIVARTVNLAALIVFLIIGFAFMLRTPDLPEQLHWIAILGLFALSVGTAGFFIVQRLGLLSSTVRAWWPGTNAPAWLSHIKIVEQHFHDFYAAGAARVSTALALAFANWLLGATEIWLVMNMLGTNLSFADAWTIEAAAQLIRAGLFFVPAALGAQEGVFLVLGGLLTGSTDAGIAMALIRRVREVIWIAVGFVTSVALFGKPVREEAA